MKILIISSSSISARKTKELVKLLEEKSCEVKVVLSDNVKKFDLDFSGLDIEVDEGYTSEISNHITLALWADLIIVYPATFNTINKYANGIADNFATSIFSIGMHHKTIICPAMNFRMYQNPIIQKNIEYLKSLNITFLGPNYGELHCKGSALGRLVEPEEIIKFLFGKNKKKLLITIGYTDVYLDDVRTVNVKSSGSMGINLIHKLKFDYDITVINANLQHLNHNFDSNIKVIDVNDIESYKTAVFEQIQNNDIFISVAAVSDLIFKKHPHKIKKDTHVNFEYEIGVDVLKTISVDNPQKICIGFALESENIKNNALKKLETKNLKMIIANDKKTLKNTKSSGLIIYKKNNKINEYNFQEMDKSDLSLKIKEFLGDICQE
ncbi:bifunctional phosphopantothenoylcysteine decarboxylase/phosphopantothenate--cysteine ligase CoaBC [Mycoplasmopsis ciconiae]|uniref:Coenzyme A biosynthesis bifunctional protein CoaBC n=1 Tax=Mycoplasmopsis ciconiae TaxID=561067 RepID=A0ABU7MLC7_9BACT|nr:bifunctional phosphopantothenoylcysteine decarboxylase/phosphopantothenate--cysteine ligase CoaBC [Mycoplasmopsis ciconiae]